MEGWGADGEEAEIKVMLCGGCGGSAGTGSHLLSVQQGVFVSDSSPVVR